MFQINFQDKVNFLNIFSGFHYMQAHSIADIFAHLKIHLASEICFNFFGLTMER